MRLTQVTDYSLRVLMFVAAHPERQPTVGEIAGSYGISVHHLTKVVHFLGKEGFLETSRGRGGGIRLARPARQISLAAVVRAAEGAAVPAACFEEPAGSCAIVRACRLHGVLREAIDAFYAVLARTTLADLTANRARLRLVMLDPALAPTAPARGSGSREAAGEVRRGIHSSTRAIP